MLTPHLKQPFSTRRTRPICAKFPWVLWVGGWGGIHTMWCFVTHSPGVCIVDFEKENAHLANLKQNLTTLMIIELVFMTAVNILNSYINSTKLVTTKFTQSKFNCPYHDLTVKRKSSGETLSSVMFTFTICHRDKK